MLELAQIPIMTRMRKEEDPIVIAGGSAVCNPEPLTSLLICFLWEKLKHLFLSLMNL